jgi:hypothetical protein
MADRPPYVDPLELAKLLGVSPDDPRLVRVADATSRIVDAYYGAATVMARLPTPEDPDNAPPWPPAVVEAALEIAVDVWRRPATPGGYFQVADYVGRLSADPTSSVATLLDSVGRLAWPVA